MISCERANVPLAETYEADLQSPLIAASGPEPNRGTIESDAINSDTKAIASRQHLFDLPCEILQAMTTSLPIDDRRSFRLVHTITSKAIPFLDLRISQKRDVQRITKRLSAVTNLDLSRSEAIDDTTMAHISRLPHLRKLDLGGQGEDIGELAIAALTRLEHLTNLNLSGFPLLTNASLQQMSSLKKLRVINLGLCDGIDRDGIKSLAEFRNLRDLSLVGSRFIDDGTLKELTNMIALEHLAIGGTDEISDDGALSLAGLKKLSSLSIYFCRNITGNAFDTSDTFPKLQHLLLAGCPNVESAALRKIRERIIDLRIQ